MHSFCLPEKSVNFCFVLVVSVRSEEARVRSEATVRTIFGEGSLCICWNEGKLRMTNGSWNILLIAYLLRGEKLEKSELKFNYQFNIGATAEVSRQLRLTGAIPLDIHRYWLLWITMELHISSLIQTHICGFSKLRQVFVAAWRKMKFILHLLHPNINNFVQPNLLRRGNWKV